MDDQLMRELGQIFVDAGHELFLVGGSVRDLVLGREPKDFDFATDATPDRIQKIVDSWAEAVWDVGARFGTIALRKRGMDVEITTFRTDGPGRKPEVEFTTSLIEDLRRRDFTINAMAMRVDGDGLHSDREEIVDPFDGRTDLLLGLLKTPRDPRQTFTEDPLRMMRAARFVAQLGFSIGDVESLSISSHSHLIDTVSAERITAEMDKIMVSPHPTGGLWALEEAHLLERIIPELRFIPSPLLGDDALTKWAHLLRHIDRIEVDLRLKRMKFSTDDRRKIVDLVAWSDRFLDIDWKTTEDSTVRRLIAAASTYGQLQRLVTLMHDDELTSRVALMLASEGAPKPPMTGKEVMLATGMKAGPQVGKAMRHLWELTLDDGPMTKDRAINELFEMRQ